MKAVLWDLDDTVLNTLPARMRSLKHAYEICVGGWVDPQELWKTHRGGSLEALGRRLVGEDWRRFAETYREHYYAQFKRARPYDGVPEVLEHLTAHGIQLAIVTSKISWGATGELEQAGLLHLFGAVVGHDDVENAKPDPEAIFEALDRLVIDDVDDVAFVGDSPADIFAAHNAGCVSIAATWGTLDEELLLDTSPTHIARAPAEIFDLLFSEPGGHR